MFNKYNWARDHHDARDEYAHSCSSFKLTAPSALPSSVDLRNFCSPVYDQGQIGSCTANALCGALEYLENKTQDFETNGQFIQLSRLFLYYYERADNGGDVHKDNGAQLSTGVKILTNIGVSTEHTWPYVTWKTSLEPSTEAYTDAGTRKIVQAARVERDSGINGIKQVLASGYPIVFGFLVYDSFESEGVASSGVLNMPQANEQTQGGHAVMMVGYDDATQRVIVRNSWGAFWGQKGYFTMPYSYVIDRNLANDLWTITQ